MLCPQCQMILHQETRKGVTVYTCKAHGLWHPWDSVRKLEKAGQEDEDDALTEGFVLGSFLPNG